MPFLMIQLGEINSALSVSGILFSGIVRVVTALVALILQGWARIVFSKNLLCT